MPSSARFKEAIKPMDKASKAIHSLQPAIFRHKNIWIEGSSAIWPGGGRSSEVNPDLVIMDEQGQPYTVRCDVVNAMWPSES